MASGQDTVTTTAPTATPRGRALEVEQERIKAATQAYRRLRDVEDRLRSLPFPLSNAAKTIADAVIDLEGIREDLARTML